MALVPDERRKKGNNKNEEKLTAIEDICMSHDVDAFVMDDKEEEIVLEQEGGTNTSTRSDSKDTSSFMSLLKSTSDSDSVSDSFNDVVCTKVLQGASESVLV